MKQLQKLLSTLFALVLAFAFATPQAAQAAVAGTVTIVSTGGSPEGTNWTYAAGEISPSTNVSINASDLVSKLASGPLTVLGDKLLVNASVIHTNANSLTFKVTGNILINGGVTIQSQGGDLVFNSDSDANGAGFVRFGMGSGRTAGAINSNGGRIIVGGGANPLTGFSYANNSDNPIQVDYDACGGNPPLVGIGIYSFAFNSGTGNIRMNGAASATTSRGFNITSCSWGTVSFTATGSGSIYLNGDGTLSTYNPWGISAGSMNMTTASGDITLEGKSSPTYANSRGMSIGGASSFTSTSGNILFKDTTVGSAVTDYRGVNLASAITVTTGGSFTVSADELTHSGTLILDVSSATIQPTNGSSFNDTYNVGAITATNADSLTIGKAGNTATVNLTSAISAGGAVNLIAGAVGINAALSSTSDISITASGAVTQTAAISAVGLAVSGTGNVNLNSQSNDVTRFAANTTGTLTFAETNGYAIGAVGAVSGVTAASQNLTVNGATNYRINFNSQGGPSVNSVLFASGGSAALPNGPSLPGYSFRGWFTASSGGTAVSTTYTPGVASDVTLYAQWALIPPPVSIGGITSTGNGLTISGSNFDRISSVKVNGLPVKLVLNSQGQITFEAPKLAPGSYTIELLGDGIKLTWENAITIKPEKPIREETAMTDLGGFAKNSTTLSTSQKAAIKKLTTSAVALSCVATVAKNATSSQKRTALAQANSACAYAKSVTPSLSAKRISAVLETAKTPAPVSLVVTKK